MHAMESAKAPASSSPPSSSSSSSSPSTSRWNPTKEQIAVLEALYRQGIRTPSAEQIQQITGKLREFGDIEGKNVFYWFQNHKARQRQKQKQESFAYFSRLLHHSQPLPPPPPPTAPPIRGPFPPPPTCTNVACSPYYLQIPQVGGRVGFYQPHFPAAMFHVNAHANPLSRLHGGYHVNARPSPATVSINGGGGDAEGDCSTTLPLFPLHPTGILEEKSSSSASELALKFEDHGDGGENQPLFNFFGGRKTKQAGW